MLITCLDDNVVDNVCQLLTRRLQLVRSKAASVASNVPYATGKNIWLAATSSDRNNLSHSNDLNVLNEVMDKDGESFCIVVATSVVAVGTSWSTVFYSVILRTTFGAQTMLQALYRCGRNRRSEDGTNGVGVVLYVRKKKGGDAGPTALDKLFQSPNCIRTSVSELFDETACAPCLSAAACSFCLQLRGQENMVQMALRLGRDRQQYVNLSDKSSVAPVQEYDDLADRDYEELMMQMERDSVVATPLKRPRSYSGEAENMAPSLFRLTANSSVTPSSTNEIARTTANSGATPSSTDEIARRRTMPDVTTPFREPTVKQEPGRSVAFAPASSPANARSSVLLRALEHCEPFVSETEALTWFKQVVESKARQACVFRACPSPRRSHGMEDCKIACKEFCFTCGKDNHGDKCPKLQIPSGFCHFTCWSFHPQSEPCFQLLKPLLYHYARYAGSSIAEIWQLLWQNRTSRYAVLRQMMRVYGGTKTPLVSF